MPSGHAGASLLHLNRPTQLNIPAVPPRLEVVVNDDESVIDGTSQVASSPTSSIHSSTAFLPPRCEPTSKVDLNAAQLERPAPLRRSSGESGISTSSANSENIECCVDILRSVQPSLPVAKPKSEWQLDEESALCNHPFCSTMFGSTTLSLGPRRHHCRRCGLIFCNAHSSRRLPLNAVNSKGALAVQNLRVCDGCYAEDDAERRASDATTPSLTSSVTSAPDAELVSPRPSFHRSQSQPTISELQTPLAPIEDWMDRSGILSLYPLAVQASHSRRSPTTTRAAAPLFAPSLKERRYVQEKELERLFLRQKRNARPFWAHSTNASDAESDAEGVGSLASSWSKDEVQSTGTRTPLQERALDWSTF